MTLRHIIQIQVTERAVFALCNDGTIWKHFHKQDEDGWQEIPVHEVVFTSTEEKE